MSGRTSPASGNTRRLLARIPKSLSNSTSTKRGAEGWKDALFKKHPEADASHDGGLSGPEYKAYKARLDAEKTRKARAE